LFRPIAPEMIERQVRGDASCPGPEVAIRAKLVPSAVNAPKRLSREIFCRPAVAHNAHNPSVNVALKLPNQRFERIDLAKREPPEQIHDLPYYLITR
jgi:hypothetical protein